MRTFINTTRAIIAIIAVAAALVACDSAKTDTADEPMAEATAPGEETAQAEATGEEVAEEADEAEKAESESADEAKEADEAETAEAPAPGGDDKGESAKRKDIRKLLEVTGSAELGMQVVDQMLGAFKTSAPNVPEKFWNEFRSDISEDGMIDIIVPIYDKHLTHQEIKALLTFFQTPAGKSYVSKLPVITRESQLAGQEWGRDIAMKVQKRLAEEGYQ